MLLLSACAAPKETPEQQTLKQIEISDVRLTPGEHPDTKVIKASIKNNSYKPIDTFSVTILIKDDNEYLTNYDSRDIEMRVEPGKQKDFEVFIRNKPEYKAAELRVNNVELGTSTPKPVATPKPLEPPLTIQPGWKWVVEGNYCYVRGSVKNTGGRIIDYFKVTAKFQNDKGQVVDSGYTNDLLNLKPGEAQKFEIMHKYSAEIKYVSVEITDIAFK
jgi:hypothetical protein